MGSDAIANLALTIALGGGCVGLLLHIRGIRKRLRFVEARYRALVREAADALVLTDEESTILEVNPAACAMLGYEREELEGLDLVSLIDPSNLQEAPLRIDELRRGLPILQERRLIHKNGHHVWGEISASRRSSGCFQAIIRDISERKRGEEERRKLESQLRQAQKMETVGTLAGGIAHDFNNILTSIFGYCELARTDLGFESSAHAELDQVMLAASRAQNLVKQILTFSRQVDQAPQAVAIQDVIAEALELLRATLPSSVELRRALDPSTPAVMADPTQIHQVLMNLCTNAVHAISHDNGIVRVEVGPLSIPREGDPRHPDVAPGSYALMTVHDNGSGIDPTTRSRIFEPFFTTKEVGRGTGLGLSVVHGIVMSHGGEILVESEPGHGTRFSVYLPSVDDPQEEERPPRGAGVAGSEHILFVDDELAITKVIAAYLERTGHRVTTHVDATAALAEFRADPNRFDIVISDLTMPHMSGIQLAEKISAERPDLPIVLISGYSENLESLRARAIGVREFAMKPLAPQDLTRIIREVLESEPVA